MQEARIYGAVATWCKTLKLGMVAYLVKNATSAKVIICRKKIKTRRTANAFFSFRLYSDN
jgi:ActR/RegA family two-component response regulator